MEEETKKEMRIVFCSAPKEEASHLARSLIEEKLAACVQIFPLVQSVYWWEGQVCEEEEAVLLCKTSEDNVAALTEFIKAHHSYDVPEVLSLPVPRGEGNEDYFLWLTEVLGRK